MCCPSRVGFRGNRPLRLRRVAAESPRTRPQMDIWRPVRRLPAAALRMRCGQLTTPISAALAPGGLPQGEAPRGPLRAASPCLRHLPSEAALLRRIGLQGKPRGAVRGCGASSRAGWLGGIPPAPPARESACPRARLSRPPLTPRASSCGRLRAEGRRCAVRGHIPSRHVPVVRRNRPVG